MKIKSRLLLILTIFFLKGDLSAQTPNTLNVGVLLPFYSDTSSSLSQKQISQAALDYYAGLRIAAEDLNKWNISVNLRVWDLQKMNDSALILLPKSAEFQSLDVFIGPITQKPVDLISTNLQTTDFLWVSPLTNLKLPKIVQNVNFFGHDSLRVKGLVHKLKLTFPQHTFCLIIDKKNQSLLKYYKKELKKAKINFTEHYVSGNKVSPKINSKSESLILLNVGTNSFSRLAEYSNVSRKVDSYIVGDFSWFDDLSAAEEIDETKIIYPSMNYINGLDSSALRFTETFIKSERAEPSKFGFQAYDQLIYLGGLFATHGRLDLNDVPNATYNGMINSFEIKKSVNNTFVNQSIRFIRNEKIELAPVEDSENQK